MTARWSSWKGNGVPDDDSVVADQDLLDQQSDHALALDYVESFGRRAQTGEKRGQRFSETQIGARRRADHDCYEATEEGLRVVHRSNSASRPGRDKGARPG